MTKKLSRRVFIKRGSAVGLSAAAFPYISCSGIKKERPNIVFLYTDQQHGFTINENEDNRFDTPNMDSIAEKGVCFLNSFCSTPQCSASRASLMIGQYTHRTGVITNLTMGAGRGIPLNPAISSMGKIFRDNGYRTAYYGKWHLGGDPKEHGWMENEMLDAKGNSRARGKKLTGLGVSFLNSKPKEPFFLFLSYLNPHDVYHFSQRNERAKDKSDVKLPESFRDDLKKKPYPQRQFMIEDQGKFIYNSDIDLWEAYRQYYREKVKMVDTEIGVVLDALNKSGLSENTMIVLTSDHGDMDTAHRLVFKGPFMYEEMLRIPLIISYPGNLPTGEKREQMVQNIDLLPTLAEAAGIRVPHLIDGKSLMPVLQDKNSQGRDYIISEYYAKQEWITPIRSIRTKDWKYNLYKKWGEELYSLRGDPKETNNLADNFVYKEKKEELQKKLEESMKATDDYFRYLRPTDRKGRVLDT